MLTNRHTLHKLGVKEVGRLNGPGKYMDGGGLRLIVDARLNKRWVMRISLGDGKSPREFGLGSYPAVTLAEARKQADGIRADVTQGRIPRRKARRPSPAVIRFEQAWQIFWQIKKPQLNSARGVQQWERTMADHVLPVIGLLPVADIATSDVIEVLLQPVGGDGQLWYARPEIGKRTLMRMSAVFEAAIMDGHRRFASPTNGVTKRLGTDHRVTRHMPALPADKIAGAIELLRASKRGWPATQAAMERLILTACRSNEVRGAIWGEVDRNRRIWTIPAVRLKGRREGDPPHRVPLTDRCLSILDQMAIMHAGTPKPDDLIFLAPRGGQLSDNTLSKRLREQDIGCVPHGFRSSFRDWAAQYGADDRLAELCLAHSDQNSVRAAYLRDDLVEQRRPLMERWAALVLP